MKYFHRNYFFLLTASALTTVLWSLTYTTSRYRTRFSLMLEVDGTAETSGFAENIGPVSYTHLDVYKRQHAHLQEVEDDFYLKGCLQQTVTVLKWSKVVQQEKNIREVYTI